MRIGIGLPTSTPGADGPGLVDWARRLGPHDLSLAAAVAAAEAGE